MAIFDSTSGLPRAARGSVVAIGNFDGVHRGHEAVIAAVDAQAAALGAPRAVLTFTPHPRRFFQPAAPPFELVTFETKARLLADVGVEHIFRLTFDAALSHVTAQGFVEDILVGDLAVRHVVVGQNFAFGHRRGGNVDYLQERGRTLGFGVTVLPARVDAHGEVFSSSAVRAHLTAARPRDAARLLGRYWELAGEVVPGARLGRDLGFPTANVALSGLLEPAYGVYAVRAGIDRGGRTLWRPGVANIGIRPMVDSTTPLLETHIFDADEDLYGQTLRVAFVEHLRPEARFADMDAMVAQMHDDAAAARALLGDEVLEGPWPNEADAATPEPELRAPASRA